MSSGRRGQAGKGGNRGGEWADIGIAGGGGGGGAVRSHIATDVPWHDRAFNAGRAIKNVK